MDSGNAFDQIAPSYATSSCSALQCDIFINHRGVDVKHKIASTSFHTLDLLGLRAFLDVEVIEAGDVIPLEIQAAITHASLHIAIFSPNYAQSPWCLAELSFMLKTGTKIIPIFYYVDPSDLRWITQGKGIYADAFSQHEKKGRYTPEKLQEWMKALHDVSFLEAHKINDYSGDEGRVLKNVVNCLVKAMKRVPLEVAKYPVGMDEVVTNFERNAVQSAQKHHNVKIQGIVGMGGSGKTTLAKELFNRKSSSFERSSFIFDIRGAAQNDLHNKQKKLLQDLLHISDLSLGNVEDGKRILSNRLRYVRALIVLDDVDHIDQLDALLPNLNNLGSDSLVIVTTRELGVLASWDIYSIYKMPGLNDSRARQLFCWHAFLQPSPLSGFETLVERFLKVCNGLPLSLKVLGGQLHGREAKDYWRSQLNKISRILLSDIIKRLKVSFDALDREEQEMFLDVACFLIGQAKSVAIALWDGSGWSGLHGLETLVNKCLVELIYDKANHTEKIRMHDHLRDMGREIATTHSPNRYWSSQQILNIHKHSGERMPIRGISSETLKSEFFLKTFVGNSRRGFKRLRSSLASEILLVSGNEFTEEIVSLSQDLVWLCWDRFPHRNLPSWVTFTSLTVLQISDGDIEELWGDNVDPPLKLIELDFTSRWKLQRFPTSIGRLKHLKRIIFDNRWDRRSPCSSLPEEFCDLQSLEHLVLKSFESLLSLPARFGELKNLRHINLSRCSELKKLPVSFKHLIHLEFMDLSYCIKLKLRSDMLEKITKLEYLDLNSCRVLEELPSQITNQFSLKRLTAKATSLRCIPNDIGLLRKLTKLSIGSNLLTTLPTSLGNLSCLTNLFICCPLLTSLPASLGSLSSLTSFHIFDGKKLEDIPHWVWGLKLLGRVTIKCPGIRELPFRAGDFALHKLESIELSETGLSEISISEDCCPNLKDLTISDNAQLMEITCLPTTINTISLRNCHVLKNIRCIGGVVNLRELLMFSRIEGIQHCRSLKKLKVKTSWELPEIQSLGKMDGLEELSITCLNMSAIKPFVQSLKECSCWMEIEGRVSGFLQPILNSLEFPDLIVMDWEKVYFPDLNQLLLYFPNFLCFPIHYIHEEENYFEEEEEEEEDGEKDEEVEEEEEKDENEEGDKEDEEKKEYHFEKSTCVHIALFRQASEYEAIEYFESRSDQYFHDYYLSKRKAMVVAGEEAKLVEAFYKILSLV
ncbi:disease resistance protein Roq1-like [Cryptomeria japonica]|uniref:disease resistance protein Roq1-like n=1 Tax=Cryptomeria japonica TaxID=3369 RepID=UPI0027DAADC9|nr:disease resistance protein Roq1-like [Cryptomeria japonica]